MKHISCVFNALCIKLIHIGFVGCTVGVSVVVIFRNLEFENDQKAHQQSQLQILRSAHQGIVDTMTRIYNTFSDDGHEVCSVFLSFIQYW